MILGKYTYNILLILYKFSLFLKSLLWRYIHYFLNNLKLLDLFCFANYYLCHYLPASESPVGIGPAI